MLRMREMRFGLLWVNLQGPRYLLSSLLFEAGVGGLVEILLRVRAGERGARQREFVIKSHCLFELPRWPPPAHRPNRPCSACWMNVP